MSDLDDRLRAGLDRLASDRTPAAGDADQVDAIRRRATRRRRTRVAAGVALPLAAAVLIATVAWPDEGRDTPVVTDTAPETTAPDRTSPTTTELDDDDAAPVVDTSWDVPGVESLDPGPLSRRMQPEVVWTPHGLIVWGGTRNINFGFDDYVPFLDGAMYEVETRRWTTIPPAPLTATEHAVPRAVWTGEELVALLDEEAAAWDPQSRTWRELGAVPLTLGSAVWTGEEVLTMDYSLDPSSGEWRRLPERPLALERISITWTGAELIVLGRPAGEVLTSVAGVAYDPAADSWRELPRGPMGNESVASAWTGARLLVMNYDMPAAMFDPATNEWQPIDAVPSVTYEAGPRAVHSGEYTAVLTGGAMVVRTPEAVWIPVGYPEELGLTGVGAAPDGTVFLFGSEFANDGSWDANLFFALDLERLADGSTVAVPTRLDLPVEATVVESRGELHGDSIVVRMSMGAEDCHTEWRYGTEVIDRAGGTIEVEPVHGGETWTGHLSDDHTSIFRGGLEVSCETPETTLELARHLRYPPDGPGR